MQDTVDQAHSAVPRTLADIIQDARSGPYVATAAADSPDRIVLQPAEAGAAASTATSPRARWVPGSPRGLRTAARTAWTGAPGSRGPLEDRR